jgi:hypothetical protein
MSSDWLPDTAPGAATVRMGLPGVADPNQNEALLWPAGIVMAAVCAEVNWADPKVAPADGLLLKLTVSAPAVIGVPAAVCRRTVMGPRFGSPDAEPETGGELNTSVWSATDKVNFCVAAGATPLAAFTHKV